MSDRPHDTVDLVVNGARLAEAEPTDLSELERPLRSLALADSPVLLRGRPEDCRYVAERLHALSRRSGLPLHVCETVEAAEPLIGGAGAQGAGEPPRGTWTLIGVEGWPAEAQRRLASTLESLDESRLLGRLRHEHIPRVLVITPDAPEAALPEALAARLSYFKLHLEHRRAR